MKPKAKMKIRTRISIGIMSFAVLYVAVRVIESLYMTGQFVFHLFDAVLFILFILVIIAFIAKMGKKKPQESQPTN
ncbi:MAG: hypothetical protein ACRCWD_07680 [Culicoidibacterales bacterium]